MARLELLLSVDEVERAARFHSAKHSSRFIVAHARLRQELARLLSVAPDSVVLDAGPHGKPALAGELASSGLEFNLSHSASLGLVGWAWSRAIGVDIEFWRPTRDEAALVRRFFSTTEIAEYEALEHGHHTEAFFNGWTRKEAYVKAVGRGIGLPLDSFDITLGPAAEARLLRPSVVPGDNRRWTLAALDFEAGVSVALVLEGDAFHVRRQ